MSIASTDIKYYQAANHAEDDASTQGGAIATAGKTEFTDLAAADTLDVLSSNAGDTMNLTITGRTAAGAIVQETRALNGTTPVTFATNTLERFLKALLASVSAGTITIRRTTGGATVATLEAGFTSTRRLFYDSASDPSVQKIRYEKLFVKNTHGSLQMNAAAIKLTADPSATIRIGCAPSKGDSASVANRLTAPSSVTFVDDNVSQSIPTGALAAGESIGIWVEMTLAAANAAVKSTFTVQTNGTSI